MKHLTKFETLEQAQGLVLDHTNTPHISLIEELRNTTTGGLTFTNYIPFHDYSQDYFTLIALENGSFDIICPSGGISYSDDGGETWSDSYGDHQISDVTAGSKILLKGDLFELDSYIPAESGEEDSESTSESESLFANFINATGNYAIEGNIMSLLFEDNFRNQFNLVKNGIFKEFFRNDTKLISIQNLVLPATTLTGECYSRMFEDCSSLTTALNILPATTLAYYCYSYMFQNCTSLTTAPELPATSLADNCYTEMFNCCTSLTTAPELPATTLANNCYSYMFDNCTSLTTAPELPATTLAEYCYEVMFGNCASLTTAPELPATTLEDNCYRAMFSGCTALTTAPELPATTLADNCYNVMFSECTALTTAPELPATTLAENCYSNMFYGCTSLNYIKCLATDISAHNCLYRWMNGVAATGTFIKDSNVTWPTGDSGIPSGWTVQDA